MNTDNINVLGRFLGRRDVGSLSKERLEKTFGFSQADVMVLFGGSIIPGGDVLAEAIWEGVAKHYVIVGGAGHTTQTLREKMGKALPHLKTEGLTEAELFNRYLLEKFDLQADFLETRSTNCGNNITCLLELLETEGISCDSVILSQDATMQLRMAAGMKKYRPEMTIINYATYEAVVTEKNGIPVYQVEIPWMWEIDRYIGLLLGEIPRLSDDENGYGPRGKNFIAHVDIPKEVWDAWRELSKTYMVRNADPAFAGK